MTATIGISVRPEQVYAGKSSARWNALEAGDDTLGPLRAAYARMRQTC